jgi:hypothetical protein
MRKNPGAIVPGLALVVALGAYPVVAEAEFPDSLDLHAAYCLKIFRNGFARASLFVSATPHRYWCSDEHGENGTTPLYHMKIRY